MCAPILHEIYVRRRGTTREERGGASPGPGTERGRAPSATVEGHPDVTVGLTPRSPGPTLGVRSIGQPCEQLGFGGDMRIPSRNWSVVPAVALFLAACGGREERTQAQPCQPCAQPCAPAQMVDASTVRQEIGRAHV